MKRTLAQTFSDWIQKPLGRELLNDEKQKVVSMLKDKRFNFAVLVGDDAYHVLVENLLTEDYAVVTENQHASNAIISRAEFLPIKSNSVDLLILPHTLDFSRRSYRVLREADHCLQGDGKIVVIGFNSFSLWGIRQLFSFRHRAPWNARFHTAWKIQDWLRVLNYKVIQAEKIVYRFPVKSRKVYQRLGWLSKLLRKCLPFSGAVYIITARKRVLGVTPLKTRWARVKKAINANGVLPVSRNLRKQNDN